MQNAKECLTAASMKKLYDIGTNTNPTRIEQLLQI